MNFMEFTDLIRAAYKEKEYAEFYDGDIATWILEKGRVNDLILIINNSELNPVTIKNANGKNKSIHRLKDSDDIISVATLIGSLGYIEEAQEIFDAIISRTPNDVTALNNYGYILLMNLIEKEQLYDREKILIAQKVIAKAASINKNIEEKPQFQPIYKNLCFLRVVEAEYYAQNKAYLPAFLMACMSIEMSIYRIFYQHLKEKHYEKGSLLRLNNLDNIIEILFLNKCDPELVKSKAELTALKGLRNDLIHGDVFEISKGEAKCCIDLAYAFTLIKVDYTNFLRGIQRF